MILGNLFKKSHMSGFRIKAPFLEIEWTPNTADKNAAWELYIELLTRVSTQGLAPDHGDEETALNSIHSLFEITRDVIKSNKSDCIEFAKIAIVILNQVVRPFTAKWHKLKLEGGFEQEDSRQKFREELSQLQVQLKNYTKMLAIIAEVEDITDIEG